MTRALWLSTILTVVIAMACHNLSDKYRNRAIFLGSAGAIVLRIIFCAVIGLLLGAANLALILLEGSYVIFVRRCG